MNTNEVSKLTGLSVRTLHHYDDIGLLTPCRNAQNGYREYGEGDLDVLQQILFFRECGFSLEKIRLMLAAPSFDRMEAFLLQRDVLTGEKRRIEAMLVTLEKSMKAMKGGAKMSVNEKFEGLKQQMLDENEKKYGDEIREKYGKDVVEESNAKFKSMTSGQLSEMQALGEEILSRLDEAYEEGDPAGEMGMELAKLHKQWLSYTWPSYTPEAHAGLGSMYAEDERFAEYYNRGEKGKAEFMRDAILHFTKQV